MESMYYIKGRDNSQEGPSRYRFERSVDWFRLGSVINFQQ